MSVFSPTNPESEEVSLFFPEFGVMLDRWTSYNFLSNFLSATDGWSFCVAASEPSEALVALLQPGRLVSLRIDGLIQGTGYIDSVDVSCSRSSGTTFVVNGRDRMAQVVDGHADPSMEFKEAQSLQQFIEAIFRPFGFTEFSVSNDLNVALMTGSPESGLGRDGTKSDGKSERFVEKKWVPRSERGKKIIEQAAPLLSSRLRGEKLSKKGKELKNVVLHQLRPYESEGLFSFASRVCQRHGLWIWSTADGRKIIVSKPNFYQEPKYRLSRGVPGEASNILDGSVTRDISDQPSIIIADAYSQGSGGFGSGRLRSCGINPAINLVPGNPAFDKYSFTQTVKGVRQEIKVDAATSTKLSLDRNEFAELRTVKFDEYTITKAPKPDTVVKIPLHVIAVEAVGEPMNVPSTKVLFLHDNESQTQEQLDNFVKRQMALAIRKSLTATYTVEGHGQRVDGKLVPWAIDTLVDVDDRPTGLQQLMYVVGRTFSKSRSGTTTKLELIRLNSLAF